MTWSVERRAALHAALGDPSRLSIVDAVASTDRSPKDLATRLGLPTNLLAHHLDVLAGVGLVTRVTSTGDRRRRYVHLVREPLLALSLATWVPAARMLFLCSHNSARSILAAALWTERTGLPASSAGTHPATKVHHGAVAAARRAGLDLAGAVPKLVSTIDPTTQVVTVCDQAHEELTPLASWWHWSIPDPVARGTAAAFDAVVTDLDTRIKSLIARPANPTTGASQ